MQTYRWILLAAGLMLSVGVIGCAGAPPPQPAAAASTPTSDTPNSAKQSDMAAEAPSPAPAVAVGADSVASPSAVRPAQAPVAGQAIASERAKTERPGLATQFGEDLQRGMRQTRFERESMTTPLVTATIWYNDAAGARAMAQNASSRSGDRAEVELFNGGLVVGVTDEWFQVLPGFVADARPYAIGEANARYAIRIANRSDFSFEVVASVDGLNVIDGRPASPERRGYVLAARDTMTIEGFRTSESTLAAFRFGRVSESYSVQMGHGDRNVGVIGVAFFQEKGQSPAYPSEDTRLRRDADPFPGEYAPRPKGR
jgi:hypothetical protein